MPVKKLIISFSLFFSFSFSFSQPFTKKYILSFHTCDASCMGFQDHLVNLAESDDGMNWTLVPNFLPYPGSVPDVIVRGNKVYVYTPGKVKRYDKNTGMWDTGPVNVSVVDLANTPVSYVDPSAIIDSSGRIVLFFLNATGVTGDPAGCNGNYPCTKYFDSAVEVSGSDGTQFVMQGGHRTSISLANSPQTASDPDIYFDGKDYILYISQGSSSLAYWGSTLHGTYQPFIIFPNNLLTASGGIPCGHYDSTSAMYWTYVHSNVSGNTVIRRQAHSDFSSSLANFTTVMSGPVIGQPASTKTESPGFCTNDLLNGVAEDPFGKSLYLYPVPSKGIFRIECSGCKAEKAELLDLCGRSIGSVHAEVGTFDFSGVKSGMYFVKITGAGELAVVRKVLIE